jgi:hypothetical protein
MTTSPAAAVSVSIVEVKASAIFKPADGCASVNVAALELSIKSQVIDDLILRVRKGNFS